MPRFQRKRQAVKAVQVCMENLAELVTIPSAVVKVEYSAKHPAGRIEYVEIPGYGMRIKPGRWIVMRDEFNPEVFSEEMFQLEYEPAQENTHET